MGNNCTTSTKKSQAHRKLSYPTYIAPVSKSEVSENGPRFGSLKFIGQIRRDKQLSISNQEVILTDPCLAFNSPKNTSKDLIKYEVSDDFLSFHKVEFVKGELIATGTFGSTYSGLSKNTGAIVAIKQVKISEKSKQKQIKGELKSLAKIDHPNLLRYIGVQCNESNNEDLEIISEFCNGGSIKQLLDKFDTFEESLIKNYLRQVLKGIKHLHDNDISHNILKNTNILVDGEGNVKLSYFDLSNYQEKIESIPVGKSIDNTDSKINYWKAPEVILSPKKKNTKEADIWAIGCFVIEMATKLPPWSRQFSSTSDLISAMKINKAVPIIPTNLSDDCRDFVMKCLSIKPEQRLKVSELLTHKFLQPSVPEPIKVLLKGNDSYGGLSSSSYPKPVEKVNPCQSGSEEGNANNFVNILQPNQNNGMFSVTLTVDSKSRYTNTLANERFKSIFKLEDLNKFFTKEVKEELDSYIDPISPNDMKEGFFSAGIKEIDVSHQSTGSNSPLNNNVNLFFEKAQNGLDRVSQFQQMNVSSTNFELTGKECINNFNKDTKFFDNISCLDSSCIHKTTKHN